MKRILFIWCAASLFAGCSDEVLDLRQQPLTEVCGVNKYQGPQGVDVSTYQPNYDWSAQAAAGIRFGYARVSNGTQIIDDQFDRNWPEMKAQGIYRGAYQYFRPGQDAVAQANLVVDKLGRLGPGDMPAMIDVETNDDQPASVVAQKVKQWLAIVEEGTGKKPTIYTGAYFWQDFVQDTTLGEYPLWIANYGADCPLVPDGWTDWTFWQYCDGNTDYCTNGMGFDRDVFNGTDEELDQIANGGTWAATITDVSPAQTVASGEPAMAYVVVQNSGTTTWDTSTKLGTTGPRDRESALATDSWEAPHRVAAVTGTVPPGESFRFEFELATTAIGSFSETFGLVQEGAAWFGDGGGPADDAIVIELEVVDADQPAPNNDTPDPMMPDPGSNNDDDGQMGPDAATNGADGLPPVVGESPGIEGGCSTASTGEPWLLLLALGFIRRR